MADKARENRARRKAERQGLQLLKSRRRDPDAVDFGGYMLIDNERGAVFGTDPISYSASLDEIEAWLTKAPRVVK